MGGCAPRSSPTCTSATPIGEDLLRDADLRRTLLDEIASRRPPRPARRRPRAARTAAARGARSGAAVLRGARRGDGRARDRPRPRQPRPPPRRAAAGKGREGERRRPIGPGAARASPREEPTAALDALARRRRADARLPRRLAARRRLRHPRPLHGLPHEPAANRVHRRGRRDAGLRPGPGPGRRRRLRARPASRLRLLLRPRPVEPGARARPAPRRAPGARSPAATAGARACGRRRSRPRSAAASRRPCGR